MSGAVTGEFSGNRTGGLVVFSLDEQGYGLDLSVVQRIVRAMEITPLPKAPEIVLGLVNLQGRVYPVVNARRRFRLVERPLHPQDHLILATTKRRPVAMAVDGVTGVVDRPPGRVTAAEAIVPGLEYVEGVARLEDGLILIHDLDQFLSLDEERLLDEAFESHG